MSAKKVDWCIAGQRRRRDDQARQWPEHGCCEYRRKNGDRDHRVPIKLYSAPLSHCSDDRKATDRNWVTKTRGKCKAKQYSGHAGQSCLIGDQ
jgi:hypothetical protein